MDASPSIPPSPPLSSSPTPPPPPLPSSPTPPPPPPSLPSPLPPPQPLSSAPPPPPYYRSNTVTTGIDALVDQDVIPADMIATQTLEESKKFGIITTDNGTFVPNARYAKW